MTLLKANLEAVRARIARACTEAGRSADEVTLLAVSKTFGADAVREAVACGQRRFGENQVQEAVDKIEALAADPAAPGRRLEWHLIGPLQSNKTRLAAEHFDWVQSVDRLKIAERLSGQRPAALPPLQVCIQVNISGEESKHGVSAEALPALAREIAALPRLQLRGLMAIPQPSSEVAEQRAAHAALRRLWLDLREAGLPLDTLSIGMSDDLEAAIAEGATLVRVGSAIFGRR